MGTNQNGKFNSRFKDKTRQIRLLILFVHRFKKSTSCFRQVFPPSNNKDQRTTSLPTRHNVRFSGNTGAIVWKTTQINAERKLSTLFNGHYNHATPVQCGTALFLFLSFLTRDVLEVANGVTQFQRRVSLASFIASDAYLNVGAWKGRSPVLPLPVRTLDTPGIEIV